MDPATLAALVAFAVKAFPVLLPYQDLITRLGPQVIALATNPRARALLEHLADYVRSHVGTGHSMAPADLETYIAHLNAQAGVPTFKAPAPYRKVRRRKSKMARAKASRAKR